MTLLAVGVYAIATAHQPGCSRQVYSVALAISAMALVLGLTHLLTASAPAMLTLPLGLPWLGTHFRLDALSAFFLIVVNLGGAVASLFALGYGSMSAPRSGYCLFFRRSWRA